jgi:hypothetical protein
MVVDALIGRARRAAATVKHHQSEEEEAAKRSLLTLVPQCPLSTHCERFVGLDSAYSTEHSGRSTKRGDT